MNADGSSEIYNSTRSSNINNNNNKVSKRAKPLDPEDDYYYYDDVDERNNPTNDSPVVPPGFLSPSVREYLDLGKSIPGMKIFYLNCYYFKIIDRLNRAIREGAGNYGVKKSKIVRGCNKIPLEAIKLTVLVSSRSLGLYQVWVFHYPTECQECREFTSEPLFH